MRNSGDTTRPIFHRVRSLRVALHSNAVAHNTSECTRVGWRLLMSMAMGPPME